MTWPFLDTQHKARELRRSKCQAAYCTHLDTRVCFMHELKQLVDHRLQELPVGPQKLGVLAHHIPTKGREGMEHRGQHVFYMEQEQGGSYMLEFVTRNARE
eukprot:1153835-Pelagomonas_calceolata.AAC.2